MRIHRAAQWTCIALIAQTALGQTALSAPLTLDQLPHQKPGLWRNTMVVEGAARALPTMDMCLDAASEARMSVWNRAVSNGQCSSQQFNRNLDGSISFKAVCNHGPEGQRVTSGTVVGDFNTRYKISIESVAGGTLAQGAKGERRMTISATWLGPCAPGQKGGDVIMPDGRVINMGG